MKLHSCILLAALPAALWAQQPATPVTALGNLAHAVESLEKTVPFYRDVLGLTANGDPLAARPQVLDADMSRFTATQGASFRAAVFRIPGASFGWELTEFTGTARKADRFAIQDPGSVTLALQVRDMDKMMAKLKAANVQIVTTGGVPVNPTGNPNSKLREILVRDPDGFFVELQQPDPLPPSAADNSGDILGASVQIAVEDLEASVNFYREAFGYSPRYSGAWGTNETVLKLIGLQNAQWRIAHGTIPGFPTDFALIEYSGVPRTKRSMGAADPGSPAFTMVVNDIDAAVNQWKSAGGTVVTTGGAAVKRPNGAGNVFVRDINGLLWELFTRATPPAKGK